MPFQAGNKHGAKRKQFEATINRIIAQDDGKKLRAVAEKVWELAQDGERWAVEMIRDTLDGRPATALEVADESGNAVTVGVITWGTELPGDTAPSLPAPGLPSPSTESTRQRH
jgi:hypothetical protein